MARDVEAQLNYIESLISSVDSQIDTLNKAMIEVQNTIDLLSNSDLEKSPEKLISIGSGLFAKGSISIDQDLIVPIGSGIYVAENRERSIERLKKNLDDIKASMQKLLDQRKTLVDQYNTVYATEATRNVK
ncbi:prefoldin subunit alpha [Thermoplasma sp.]|uniref:prefoldin subunit alpha n=1 Tax=Thermoplasma sp. TaxID=1973142 RepID=UPI0012745C79|nr:prefoldin subunit alpha [Thermoplasma sp.]KAA8922978.1 MAG: prefoldin subunit alpha [Thermoplasma sp.]